MVLVKDNLQCVVFNEALVCSTEHATACILPRFHATDMLRTPLPILQIYGALFQPYRKERGACSGHAQLDASGAICQLQHDKLVTMRIQLAAREAQVTQLQGTLGKVKAELAASEAQVTQLQEALGLAKGQMAFSEAQLTQLQEALGVAKGQMAASEAQVTQLQGALGKAETQLVASEAQVTQLRSTQLMQPPAEDQRFGIPTAQERSDRWLWDDLQKGTYLPAINAAAVDPAGRWTSMSGAQITLSPSPLSPVARVLQLEAAPPSTSATAAGSPRAPTASRAPTPQAAEGALHLAGHAATPTLSVSAMRDPPYQKDARCWRAQPCVLGARYCCIERGHSAHACCLHGMLAQCGPTHQRDSKTPNYVCYACMLQMDTAASSGPTSRLSGDKVASCSSEIGSNSGSRQVLGSLQPLGTPRQVLGNLQPHSTPGNRQRVAGSNAVGSAGARGLKRVRPVLASPDAERRALPPSNVGGLQRGENTPPAAAGVQSALEESIGHMSLPC